MKNETTIETTAIQEFTEQFINQTNQSVFLTGKAGTGKTTLLHKIVQNTHKQYVIVAPTGIAALNAGGVTIHSFFQLPFGGFIPDFAAKTIFNDRIKFETKASLGRHFNLNAQRLKMIRCLELLIIDEVSMLRADLLDAIDWSLRSIRKNNVPYGGVQVLFIGDLLQLPPIVKPEEWSTLSSYYSSMYFFDAHVAHEQRPVYIELDKIYRQNDQVFIDLLNNLRNNKLTIEDQNLLQKYVKPNFDSTKEDGYITLTTHNSKADSINATTLAALTTKNISYFAEIEGEFPENLFPIEAKMELKIGAQVMFVKNDISQSKAFYNGKMGRIKSLSEEEIEVLFPEENISIVVEKYEWENIKYTIDKATGEISEKVIGTFVHYPLKLAWAITVHKSQGLTFEKAVLEVSQVFAPGQAYVAFSRLRSLNGLVLLSPLGLRGMENDQQVVKFGNTKPGEELLKQSLQLETARYCFNELTRCFDWYLFESKWTSFELSTRVQGPKTEKGKDKQWAATQQQIISGASIIAKKFKDQINQIFSKTPVDWEFLKQRTDAAHTYFFEKIDNQLYSLLKRKLELARLSKTKQYMDELSEIEELVLERIILLNKSKAIVESIYNGRPLTKSNLQLQAPVKYVLAKISVIQNELRQNKTLLDEPIDDFSAEEIQALVTGKKETKPKKEKIEKINTHEVTLNMILDGKSTSEIAKERQLSLSTIEGHIAKLITLEKIELTDVLNENRIKELESFFDGYEETTVGALKEKLGDKVSWSELKMFQAHKLR